MKIILKFIFSLGIIYWLAQSNRLDFSLVKKAWLYPWSLIACSLMLISQDMIACFRWMILMKTDGEKKIPFLGYLKTNWIGLFFNSILPGAVTGDLVKMFYARQLNPSLSKSFIFTTILLDRVTGLCGIFLLLGIFSIFTYSQIHTEFPRIIPFLQFNFMLLAGVLLFIFFLFLPGNRQNKIVAIFTKIPFIGKKTAHLLGQGVSISSNKKNMVFTLLLSIVSQTLAILSFWIMILPFTGNAIPFQYAFTLFPLGFIMIAIPISPAGLGVGHAIFDILFRYFNIEGGASLFNIYFIIMVSLHLLGGIPYILSRKKPALNQD
ncbi:MAG: lysylphosphatidylglycerol synthase transmembrane domain-containing protein, partial [Halobacteriovoraceae bacterium]|nr:lysylphosphatidylglycerol synthase transmembrane domain-containing protein [Halobacteriovoraceae bacterium]